jgi:hypothetical protein
MADDDVMAMLKTRRRSSIRRVVRPVITRPTIPAPRIPTMGIAARTTTLSAVKTLRPSLLVGSHHVREPTSARMARAVRSVGQP